MIIHLVLLQPHAALTRDDQHAILERIRSAVEACPSVRACRIGRRVLHGLTGYEQNVRTDYRYALIVEFSDVDGLREYLAHPAHAPLGEVFTTATAAALACDYEMVDVRDAHKLL